MDYFNDVFTTFLGLESGSCIGFQWRDSKLRFHYKEKKVLRVWNDVRLSNNRIFIFG